MKRLITVFLVLASMTPAFGQQEGSLARISTRGTSLNENPNLPIAKIGRDDLLGITVYDEPELTRTVRVDSEGYIRLPMFHKPVHAAGLLPVELEQAIASALLEDN
ncbi:MAG TPA: polysaccharide biosynthesis/export family protein, partial [Terriglobales bacterium]